MVPGMAARSHEAYSPMLHPNHLTEDKKFIRNTNQAWYCPEMDYKPK